MCRKTVIRSGTLQARYSFHLPHISKYSLIFCLYNEIRIVNEVKDHTSCLQHRARKITNKLAWSEFQNFYDSPTLNFIIIRFTGINLNSTWMRISFSKCETFALSIQKQSPVGNLFQILYVCNNKQLCNEG
jgi:hypothetical protein